MASAELKSDSPRSDASCLVNRSVRAAASEYRESRRSSWPISGRVVPEGSSGVLERLGSVGGAGFRENSIDVRLDGMGAQEEASCDLRIGEALPDEVENLALARGEAIWKWL